MHQIIKPVAIAVLCGSLITPFLFQSTQGNSTRLKGINPNAAASPQDLKPAPDNHMPVKGAPASTKKIQVAVLLDVSNSMDGLIAQAKTQLWNIVSVMGRAKCDGLTPKIEIALYEYGRDGNNPREGYVKQINSFTNDLDQVSHNLFSLSTNGGSEYCGHVIHKSISELPWDDAAGNYKVIFIAGNEDFLQGGVSFTKACSEAGQKGVIVNTIYCGDKMQGIREHWNLGSECGKGSFTNIDQNATLDDIATPYDDKLFALNEQLNGTYIGYGVEGEKKQLQQKSVDVMNYSTNKAAAAQRVAVKGKKSLYKNSDWDMVDAYEADQEMVNRLDKKSLPDSLKNKPVKEIEKFIRIKAEERKRIQESIEKESAKRELFLAAERKKNAGQQASTLETVIEKIVKEQAKRFNMVLD